MKEFIKNNFAILLAFLLPIALIVFIALSVYLPSLFLSTKYNFIYVTCVDGTRYYDQCNDYVKKQYSVVNEKLVVGGFDQNLDTNKNGFLDVNEKYTARIFLHDTEKNESREISQEEAKALVLDGLITSPDGVTVSSNYNYNGSTGIFPFSGSSYSSYGFYLSKGNSHRKLNLINNNDRYYYQNNFQFLGWVLPGRN